MTYAASVHGLLGAVLTYAALSKIAAFREVSSWFPTPAQFQRYRKVLACALVGSEALVGFGLLASVMTPWPQVLALTLFSCFTAFAAVVWVRRIDVECRCFGTAGKRIDGLAVLRNAALTALAACSLFLAPVPYGLAETLAGVGLFVLVLLLAQATALVRPAAGEP